ncbi:MAG: UDP-N-acetylglucosamine 2-epimerase (non-hydrolyzing) [Longimicrobiales bacterium]|nr:UDP-N-acetylglucosamine 2-epimerase (non-hydrolyzing) [Longimicrobiales bacterium]
MERPLVSASPRAPFTVLHVVGARPNFMKVAPVLRAMEARHGLRSLLVHTGQHYDAAMSDAFFQELGIPEPDVHLGVGSGTHAKQTAWILAGMEDVLLERRPDMVMVVGDVNSTVAGALAAAKLQIPVAHLEAGLRSRDRRMPEELNRLLTDQLSDLCLTPSRDGDANLLAEGIGPERIRFVGNVMIDTLERMLPQVRDRTPPGAEGLPPGGYVVVTLHRPSNVDDPGTLAGIFRALEAMALEVPVMFPMHPRTRKQAAAFGLELDGVRVLDPLGYRDMLALQSRAGLVVTDSGGVQEETTVLGVPCLTLRDSTERPVTVTEGTNRLVSDRSTGAILEAFRAAWGTPAPARRPEGWDGRAAERVADAVEEWASR